MGEPRLVTYKGNCHCNAFKFSIQMPEINKTVQCNCSFCFKRGYEWAYPVANPLVVEKDEGKLVGYEFGAKSMVHMFCGVCGTGVYTLKHHVAEDQRLGINLRALKGVDVGSLGIETFDGGSFLPAYEAPSYEGPEPSAEIEDAKIYTGSCHCGVARLVLKTRGLVGKEGEGIKECSCGICSRYGTILIFPFSDQVCITGKEYLTSYVDAKRFQSHEFCSICGVNVYIKRLDVKIEDWEKSVGKARSLEDWRKKCPVNLRCFDGVDWEKVNKNL